MKSLVNYVTLDWDWEYDKLKPENNKLIKEIKENDNVKEIWVRKSASGRIHVKVILKKPIDFWESLYLRSKWDDDANRIRMDIVRWWENGEWMRLWDAKVDFDDNGNPIIKEAGEWIRIY